MIIRLYTWEKYTDGVPDGKARTVNRDLIT